LFWIVLFALCLMVWADKLRQTEAGKTFDQSWE